MKKIVVLILALCLAITSTNVGVSAHVYDQIKYKKRIKLHSYRNIIKEKKQLKKHLSKDCIEYEIVKMSKDTITVHPQRGWYGSMDPYFSKKKYTYKLSAKCKFYYTDVCFPINMKDHYRNHYRFYRQISKSTVKSYMKEYKLDYGPFDEVKGNYYTGSFSGEMFLKNGKIVAILADGGD